VSIRINRATTHIVERGAISSFAFFLEIWLPHVVIQQQLSACRAEQPVLTDLMPLQTTFERSD
jgi:hypothetical protein